MEQNVQEKIQRNSFIYFSKGEEETEEIYILIKNKKYTKMSE